MYALAPWNAQLLGARSVAQHGESGFVYTCGDIDALSGHLEQLLPVDGLYAHMSQAALKRGDTHSPQRAADWFVAAAELGISRRAGSRR